MAYHTFKVYNLGPILAIKWPNNEENRWKSCGSKCGVEGKKAYTFVSFYIFNFEIQLYTIEYNSEHTH